jgi:hypothetical protein
VFFITPFQGIYILVAIDKEKVQKNFFVYQPMHNSESKHSVNPLSLEEAKGSATGFIFMCA